MSEPPPALPTLGWREHVWLPDWGLQLRAKLDTGARTSALHVASFEEVAAPAEALAHTTAPHRADAPQHPTIARFEVVLGRRDAPVHHQVEAPVVGHKVVRDTGGRSERRPVVRTRVVCGPLDLVADVTLTDRTGMRFRMLLGRLALTGRCVVDPSRGYLMGPPRGTVDEERRR